MASAKKKIVVGLLIVALGLGGYALYRQLQPGGSLPPASTLRLDLAHPDALIRSRALARLPRDLSRVPLAKDVLTEEFLDYYESHEDTQAVSGAVRRIAFEHKLKLPERLVEALLDEPAEIAFWRGGDGALKYFALAMTRNSLARALQLALPILPVDAQLSDAGLLAGTDTRILALEYGYRRKLLVMARGDRVVVLSDPGMLLGEPPPPPDTPADPNKPPPPPAPPPQDNRAVKLIDRLLAISADDPSPFAEHFHLARAAADEQHTLALGARVYSLGYEAFSPGLDALSFSFDGAGNWRTAALVDGNALNAGKLDGSAAWKAAPHGASLCLLAPVEWPALAPVARKLFTEPNRPDGAALGDQAAALTGLFNGPAAVCWYPDSRLYKPLFVANLKAPLDAAASERLGALMDAAIGRGAQRAELDTIKRDDGLVGWQRWVDSPHGVKSAEGEPGMNVSLTVQGNTVVFSPDPVLAKKAADVAAKRYPAMLDSLPQAAETLAVVGPAALAGLVRREVFAALPRADEPVLRNAAEAHLLPRLDALAKYPPFRLVRSGPPPGSGLAWQTLDWQPASVPGAPPAPTANDSTGGGQ